MYYYIVKPDELYHHGIKGQRWGIRRYQNPDGSLTPAGRKRYGKLVNKLAKTRNAKKAAKIQEELDILSGKKQAELAKKKEEERKKDIKNLSNEELNALLSRMDMEKRYYDLQNNILRGESELNERLKTPEQRKKEEKAAKKEKFKRDLVDTLQRTGLDVLQQGTKRLAGHALDSLFDDGKKALANEKNKDKKSAQQKKAEAEKLALENELKKETARRTRLENDQKERDYEQSKKEERQKKKEERQQRRQSRVQRAAREMEENLNTIYPFSAEEASESQLANLLSNRAFTTSWPRNSSSSESVGEVFSRSSSASTSDVNSWASSSSSVDARGFADSFLSNYGSTSLPQTPSSHRTTYNYDYDDADNSISSLNNLARSNSNTSYSDSVETMTGGTRSNSSSSSSSSQSAGESFVNNMWSSDSRIPESMSSINSWANSSASVDARDFADTLFREGSNWTYFDRH